MAIPRLWALLLLLAFVPGCAPAPATAQDLRPGMRQVEVVGQVSAPPADVAVVELPFPAEVRMRVHPGETVREGETLADLRFADAETRERLAVLALHGAQADLREAERRYIPRLTTARRWVEEARGALVHVHVQPGPGGGPPPEGSAASNLQRAEESLVEAERYVEGLLLPHRRRIAMAREWVREAKADPGPTASLRAPMTGRVAAVTARTLVTSGPIVTLTRAPRVSVQARLPEEWSSRLRPGSEVEVVLSDGRVLPGVVQAVVTREVWRGNSATGQARGAEAEERTSEAFVDVARAARQEMLPGQWVTIRLSLEPERGLISPPLQASL